MKLARAFSEALVLHRGRVGLGAAGELKFQGSENWANTAANRKGSKYKTRMNSEPFLNLKITNE